LGFGSTARVYLCVEDEVGNRPVVVKATPLPSFEASILGKLTHENIIPIFSTGYVTDRDLNYLYMPYRGRSTLADLVDVAFEAGCPRDDSAVALAANRWMANDPWFPPAKQRNRLTKFRVKTYVDAALDLAWQIADALEYAHNQNVVHGDLKPSNVLLTPDGKPLLLDFNLSQDFTSDTSLRGGTLPYMPPEHLRTILGDEAAHDTSSAEVTADVYSFGALLYELLAGVAPHHKLEAADNPPAMAALLLGAIEKGAPSIRQQNRYVDARLDSLILRCLSYDKAKRPPTMAAIKQALQIERRPWRVAARFSRVRPVFFANVACISLAAICAGGAYFAFQPPRYLSSYERGMQLAASGDFDNAITSFTSATESNPSFSPAKFERARSLMALGDFDLAITDFHQLVRANKDPACMEYIAYCFNLKRLSVAAIPWYEMAAHEGASTIELANNLGASYVEGSSTLTVKERLALSEALLTKALQLDPTCTAVRLNFLRYSVAMTSLGNKYDPFEVWRHAEYLDGRFPNDKFIESQIATWYQSVLKRELANPNPTITPRFSPEELAARERFQSIYTKVRNQNHDRELAFELRLNHSVRPADRYFLEPKSRIR
jgi:serine/threonine protein kinase